MKIAIIAPFEEPVPPLRYGGTERVVYNLTENLVKLGHDVTLFASNDSKTSATLIGCVNEAVRTSKYADNEFTRVAQNLSGLVKAISHIKKSKFDIIHNHFGWQAQLYKDVFSIPILTTLHGILLDTLENAIYSKFNKMPYVSISNSQRHNNQTLNYVSTVYNGIDVEKFPFNDKPDEYLMFLGRIHPQKGPTHAIKIAKQTKHKIIIAAKVDPVDKNYYETEVKPYIDNKRVIFVPEPEEQTKLALLKNAKALIAPIQWDEPFGMVYLESLACGTPIITINRGSAPEIIQHERVGYLCSSTEEMSQKVFTIQAIDRKQCRNHVANHFSAEKMARGYEAVYQNIVSANQKA